MDEPTFVVDAEDLSAFACAIFEAVDVAPDDARTWADMLVWANLRGTDSHGVLRIPRYLALIAEGNIKPRPNIHIVSEDGATALIEGDWAPGPVSMSFAMDHAIERARQTRVGWCAVRNVTHAGAIGYYALMAAQRGFIGVVATSSRPMIAYHGARAPGASTNPLAIAIPGGDHPPLFIDMSSATAAMGKILAARDNRQPIPEGWALDARGRPTTDPNAVASLTPLGGAKGAGLSVMIECLTSLLVGDPLVEPSIRENHTAVL